MKISVTDSLCLRGSWVRHRVHNYQIATGNVVGAIRVSTLKQGVDGDSPDDQQKLIEQYAAARNLNVARYFVFLESASKDQQPMQEVVNYCKDPENNVQQVIIKSIDRFTRGGSEFYSELKNQLDACNVALVDVYGIIGNQKINTLEHLGVKYKWSEYSPTKKAELLEAERAKDEVRDIQTPHDRRTNTLCPHGLLGTSPFAWL